MVMNTDIPTFTAEAMVALAIGYETTPHPLLLMQLGLDPQAEDAALDFMDIIEQGSRALATLHDAVAPEDDLKARLAHNIRAMSEAPVFISMRRVDQFDSRVLYCGETLVVDVIDQAGNHCPQEAVDTRSELEDFLGQYVNHDSLTIAVPVERLEPDAKVPDDEELIVPALLSDDCAWYVVSIGFPAEAKLNILQWRSTSSQLFAFRSSEDQVSFVSTSTVEAVDSIVTALDEIRDGI